MPRFYFHILDGRAHGDDLGLELADLDAAKSEALRFAGSVLKEDKPAEIWRGTRWEMRVTDSPSPEGGSVLLSLIVSGNAPPADDDV